MSEVITQGSTIKTNAIEVPLGQVRVYVCGGGATDIYAKHLYGRDIPNAGAAQLHPVFLDTSRSNLQAFDIRNEHYELIRNADGSEIDGSGQKRDENFAVIKPTIPSILTKHKPKDVNVVVATSGGGSGNVIAWCLIEKLLEANETVFVIFIGCHGSQINAYNTMRVIQSMESLVDSMQKDLRYFWIDNDPTQTYESADRSVVQAIQTIAVFASRRNKGLDTRDLHYAVNTSVPMKIAPALGMVSVHRDNDFGTFDYADAVIGIYKTETRLPLPLGTAYETYGLFRPDVTEGGFKESLHLVIRNDVHFDIFERTKRVHDALVEKANSRNVTRTTLSGVEKSAAGSAPLF